MRVFHCMSKLMFDEVSTEAKDLVKHRPGYRAEAVATHFIGANLHAPHCHQHGVIAHRSPAAASSWKHVLPSPGQAVQFAQDGDCLPRQWDYMQRLHL